MMIGGDFNLTQDEIENVRCIDMTKAEARKVIDQLEEPMDFVSALDLAQGDVKDGEAEYVLIRISN